MVMGMVLSLALGSLSAVPMTMTMHAEDRVTTTLADVKAYCLGHWNSLRIGDGVVSYSDVKGLGRAPTKIHVL